MSELDNLLLKLSSDRTGDLKNINKIRVTKDLKIKKIAFDVFKVYKDAYDGLWHMEEDSDGSKFLVRASNPVYDYNTSGSWSVSNDYDHSSVTVNYKNVPLCSFACNEFGVDSNNIDVFKKTLLEKVSSDNLFVKNILKEQSQAKLEALHLTFPELQK